MRNIFSKTFLGSLFLAACVLALAPVAGHCQTATSKDAGLTGTHWMAGEKEGKLAFLYGASNIIAIEDIGAQRTGRPASVFVQGWTDAFKNTTYPELMAKIDDWYKTHPDQLGRNVFDVIWYEFIVPATGKK